MSDFVKILKAIENGERLKLSNHCEQNTYDYSEWSDSKEITIYLGDYDYCYSIDMEFDKDGNLIEIY